MNGYEAVKNANLFLFKSYLGEINNMDIVQLVGGVLNEFFVNLLFFLLNLEVGFFSVVMDFFENVDFVGTYERMTYFLSKSIWQSFMGGNVLQENSIAGVLISIFMIYAFLQYFFNNGNFSKKVLHLFLVIGLGFGYYGFISGQAGGIFVFKGIRDIRDEVITVLRSTDFKLGDEQISFKSDFSMNYIQDTVYQAYLYVNTGSEAGILPDGSTLDDTKMIGEQRDEEFVEVDSSVRRSYIAGNAGEDKGENRFMFPSPEYAFLKMVYVFLVMVKAFIQAVPILTVYLVDFIFSFIYLGLIIFFPFGLLLSFIPKWQNVIIGLVKGMFIATIVPLFSVFALIFVTLIDKIINALIISKVSEIVGGFPSFQGLSVIFTLLISVLITSLVYVGLYKSRYWLASLFGSPVSFGAVERVVSKMEDIVSERFNDINYSDLNKVNYDQNWVDDGSQGGYFLFPETLDDDREFYDGQDKEDVPDVVEPDISYRTPDYERTLDEEESLEDSEDVSPSFPDSMDDIEERDNLNPFPDDLEEEMEYQQEESFLLSDMENETPDELAVNSDGVFDYPEDVSIIFRDGEVLETGYNDM